MCGMCRCSEILVEGVMNEWVEDGVVKDEWR